MQSHFSLSLVASVGGLLLVVVACQATVLMKNSLEEMHYRETCARHGAGEEDFDGEKTRKKLVCLERWQKPKAPGRDDAAWGHCLDAVILPCLSWCCPLQEAVSALLLFGRQ